MTEINRHPQVLLLGNGINQWKQGRSWGTLLNDLCDDEEIKKYLSSNEPKKMPMSMQAVLATKDDVLGAIKRYSEAQKKEGNQTNPFYGQILNDEQMTTIQKLLSVKFDAILTTNYSYELEYASLGIKDTNTPNTIVKLADALERPIEKKYLFKSFNHASFNGIDNKVFHIHGEARKPISIILGSDNYARELSYIIKDADEKRKAYRKAQEAGDSVKYDSWVDYFLLGDIYVLGFGFDFAEIDLWWLLKRKKTETYSKGRVYYYDLWTDDFNEKVEMLKLMDVTPINFDIYLEEGRSPTARKRNNARFDELYTNALEDIATRCIRE